MKNQAGFTLIEMLIVVIILGTLAMIIIPQVSVSTEDAKLSGLRTNLSTVRNAIELYYHQHGQTYPGRKETDGGGNDTSNGDMPDAFVDQLTKFTEGSGKADGDYTALTAPIYGPYLKTVKLPENPYNNKDTATCDLGVTDVTTRVATPADNTGWKYYANTGVFIANNSAANAQY
jgi:prepilin-type N-terminal cleavage/methylation domain-containing protein